MFTFSMSNTNAWISGVLISSVIMKIWPDEGKIADPICTILFSIIVFSTTVFIVKDTFLILMESKPSDKNYDEIFNDLFNIDHVVKVHDLHIWSLTTDQQILTVHLAIDANVAKTEKVLQNAMKMLRAKHGIDKTTIQVEDYKASVMNDCEQCQFICWKNWEKYTYTLRYLPINSVVIKHFYFLRKVNHGMNSRFFGCHISCLGTYLDCMPLNEDWTCLTNLP